MVQTAVELTEEQMNRLQELAAKREVSVSELVRQGIEHVLQRANDMEQDDRWERALSVVGLFQSDVDDLAVNHDKYLDEAFSAST